MSLRSWCWLFLLAASPAMAACSPSASREGLDPSTVPSEVRADYAVFAQRCSKCHSLARPLESGITNDDYWALYVAKMRRMPSSGIGSEDETAILRFLKWYSAEQRKKKKAGEP